MTTQAPVTSAPTATSTSSTSSSSSSLLQTLPSTAPACPPATTRTCRTMMCLTVKGKYIFAQAIHYAIMLDIIEEQLVQSQSGNASSCSRYIASLWNLDQIRQLKLGYVVKVNPHKACRDIVVGTRDLTLKIPADVTFVPQIAQVPTNSTNTGQQRNTNPSKPVRLCKLSQSDVNKLADAIYVLTTTNASSIGSDSRSDVCLSIMYEVPKCNEDNVYKISGQMIHDDLACLARQVREFWSDNYIPPPPFLMNAPFKLVEVGRSTSLQPPNPYLSTLPQQVSVSSSSSIVTSTSTTTSTAAAIASLPANPRYYSCSMSLNLHGLHTLAQAINYFIIRDIIKEHLAQAATGSANYYSNCIAIAWNNNLIGQYKSECRTILHADITENSGGIRVSTSGITMATDVIFIQQTAQNSASSTSAAAQRDRNPSSVTIDITDQQSLNTLASVVLAASNTTSSIRLEALPAVFLRATYTGSSSTVDNTYH
ncbi:MAG: hypothetical protein WCW01_06705, partial [Gammaproteobacteria bacterium]